MESSILFLDNKAQDRFDLRGILDDLRLTAVIDGIVSIYESEEIRRFFYLKAKDRGEALFRQDIYKDLMEPKIKDIAERFLKRYKTHLIYFYNAKTVSQQQSREKWHLDAAYLYCRAVSGLDDELNSAGYSSKGLGRLHKAVKAYRSTKEYALLEKDAFDCFALIASRRYQIDLDLSGYRIGIHKDTESTDFCSEIEKTFARYNSPAFDFAITALPGIHMGDLELLILNALIQDYPEVFTELSEFAAAHPCFGSAMFDTLLPELQFYLSCMAYMKRLSDKGFPICFPEFSDVRGGAITGGYDLSAVNDARPDDITENDFTQNPGESVFLITGPNRSGKTTFARQLGQIAYFAALGLPVPCKTAKLLWFDGLFTHFAREEELSNHLGRLKEELVRLRSILDAMPDESLVILNDIFSSTTAYDAYEIGKRVIEMLSERKCVCLFVTHMRELQSIGRKPVLFVAGEAGPQRYTFRRGSGGTKNDYTEILAEYDLGYEAITMRLRRRF